MNQHRSLLVLVAVVLGTAACCFAAAPRPLKVFILAGQSNMEGQAVADLDGKDYNDGKGTLAFLMRDPAKSPLFKHLKDAQGRWAVREDVWVRYKPEQGPVKAGPLTLGFTVYGGRHHFGPELQLGHVLGDHFDDQVLLIKTAWGGKSLYRDFRPPSTGGTVGPYYTKMLADIREALAELKTDFPGTYRTRGAAYGYKGEYDLALADYNKAIEMSPDDALAYKGRAKIYFDKGEYEKAWLDVEKAEAFGTKAEPEFIEKLKKASGR